MEILDVAKQLGAAIQEHDLYKAYAAAKQRNDDDKELQDLIGEFNLIRMNINTAMSDPEKDDSKMGEFNDQLQDCYKKIMNNESMIAYNEAKVALDEIVNKVNLIISMCIAVMAWRNIFTVPCCPPPAM